MPRCCTSTRFFLSVVFVVVIVSVFLEHINVVHASVYKCYGGRFDRTGRKGAPVVMSHRGSRYLSAENTMRAFHTALQIGTDVLELDVRLTRDNQLIVFHDRTLNRTTNRQDAIRDMTLEEIMTDTNLDPAFQFGEDREFPLRAKYRDAKERIAIPLFEEVLVELWGVPSSKNPYRDVSFNVEIKDNDFIAADLLLKTVAKWGGEHVRSHLVVTSRWCNVIEYFRKISSMYMIPTAACETEATRLFVVASLWGSMQHWLPKRIIQSYGQDLIPFLTLQDNVHHPCAYQVPTTTSDLLVLKEEVVELAHALDREVHFWVINNASMMKKVVMLEADGIITDRTDIAKEVLREMTSFELRSPKDGYHHHKLEYYVPSHSMEEIHTCVTWTCIILQNLGWVLMGLMAGVTALVVAYVVSCFCTLDQQSHIDKEKTD